MNLAKIRKALVAAFGAGVAAYAAAMADGVMSTQDWITVLVSAAVVGIATWWMPNKPEQPAEPKRPYGSGVWPSPPSGGAS